MNGAANVIRKKYPDAFDGQDLKYLWETTNVVKFTDLYPGAKSICQEKYNGTDQVLPVRRDMVTERISDFNIGCFLESQNMYMLL